MPSTPIYTTMTTTTTTDAAHRHLQRVSEEQPLNPRECLLGLLDQVDDKNLHQVLKIEFKRLLNDHDRLVHMLQQRSQLLENEHLDMKNALDAMQQRHEKAVREMQFFKKKYEKLSNDMTTGATGGIPPTPTTTISTSHRSISSFSYGSEFSGESAAGYHPGGGLPPPPPPILPSSPPPPIPEDAYDLRHKPLVLSSSRSNSSSSSSQHHHHHPPPPLPIDSPSHELRRPRQNSSATSTTTSSDTQSIHSNGNKSSSSDKHNSIGSNGKSSWQHLRHPPASPTTTSSSSSGGSSTHGVPMTPVRSTTTTSGYTGHSLIQQRRVDPLSFGGADGLWDTIAKSKGSDVTVEKIISNFLRRGGSPNTAKQQPSSSSQIVKSGYGLIHALIVTKAAGSLDLLLQQGANPNVMTLSTIEEDKVTPCYLAAKSGWLPGLQKLVQAGGDLLAVGGPKGKTVLHVAAEYCHAAVVEYIVQVTRGELNTQVDANGATVLHYACASGHTDLVSLLARTCQLPVLQPDDHGELPLHWAVRAGRLEVVTLLIERFGVDCNSYVPRKVPTPLDLAKSAGHRRLVDYLKGLGALSSKKMDKRREEELATKVPKHFESTLAKHGLFADADHF